MSDPTQPAPADPAAPAVQPPAAPAPAPVAPVAAQPPTPPAPRVLNPYAAMPSRPAAPAAVAPPTEAPAPTAPAADPRIDGLMAALRESVGDYAERATHRAQEKREALSHRTGEAFDRARSGLRENMDYMLREQPLALGALSLLAGVAIGAALPRTVIETRTVRVAREPLRGARGRMDTVRSAVGEVGEKVKEAIAGGVAEGDKLREAAMRAANKVS